VEVWPHLVASLDEERTMQSNDDQDRPQPDPVDEAAAEIDARSPDAPEQIEELKDLAESLGREVDDALEQS
jgi:hypothetical protein